MGPRILIVNVNWIGDVLFSTPSIRALRAKFPDAYLASWVPPRCREVLEENPHLDEVFTAPDGTSSRTRDRLIILAAAVAALALALAARHLLRRGPGARP